MPGSPRRYATDANILFDLHYGGILVVGLRPIDCLVPDLVLAECEQPTAARVRAAGAREATFTPDEVARLMEIRLQDRDLTLADAAVFLLAKREACSILTRDAPLAKLAAGEGIPVEGTLWLVDLLVQEGHLTRGRAEAAVDQMLDNDRQIPRSKAAALIEAWREG